MSGDAASHDSGQEPNDVEVVVEKSFELDGTCAQAWERLTELTAAHDLGANMWWLPGFECPATEVTAVEARRLEVIKAEPPCEGSTIVFTFEDSDNGTRIHVTQSGFDPAFVEMAGEDFWTHGTFLLDGVQRFFLESGADATR